MAPTTTTLAPTTTTVASINKNDLINKMIRSYNAGAKYQLYTTFRTRPEANMKYDDTNLTTLSIITPQQDTTAIRNEHTNQQLKDFPNYIVLFHNPQLLEQEKTIKMNPRDPSDVHYDKSDPSNYTYNIGTSSQHSDNTAPDLISTLKNNMIIKRIPDALLMSKIEERSKFFITSSSDWNGPFLKYKFIIPWSFHSSGTWIKTWNSGVMGFSDEEIKEVFQEDGNQIYEGNIPNAESTDEDKKKFNDSFMMLAIHIDETDEFTNYIEPFSSNMYDLNANKLPYKNKSGETYNIDTSTVRNCSDKINKNRKFDDYIILAQEELKNGTKITKDNVLWSQPNDNYYKIFKQDTHDNITFYDTWNPEINNQTWEKVRLNDNTIPRQFFCADTKFTSEKDKQYYDNCIKGLYDDYKIDNNGNKTGFCLTEDEWNNDKRKAENSKERYKNNDTFKEESWENWNLKHQKQCPGPNFANRCNDFVHTLNETNNKFKCGTNIDDNPCNTLLENNPGKYILKKNNLYRKKYPTPLCGLILERGSTDGIKKKCPQMCCGYGQCPYNNKKDKKYCSYPSNIKNAPLHCPKEKQGILFRNWDGSATHIKNNFRSDCPWLCSACDE